MKIAVFDSHGYDRSAFEEVNKSFQHELIFFDARITRDTAQLAVGFPAICAFVNDKLDLEALKILKAGGTKLVLLRSAGYNHIDLKAAKTLGLAVTRVPEYSPFAVAEHTTALILTLNRKIHKAYNRVRELNFALDGLVGFDLHGKTVGVIGTGRIGAVFARIMRGFGAKVLAFDRFENHNLAADIGFSYCAIDELLSSSDVISLHIPLTPETHHLIDEREFSLMKKGAMLVNTSRGGLIATKALIASLKTGFLGSAALDVYEEEEGVFFHDLSQSGLGDDVLARLLTFPNVLITSHQAFLTKEALANIAETTLESAASFERGEVLRHRIE